MSKGLAKQARKAIEHRDPGAIERLLEDGLAPEAMVRIERDGEAHQAGLLHLAAAAGDDEIGDLLLAAGAPADLLDGLHRTAWHIAAERDDARFLALADDHDANVNVRDARGRTPLLVAAAALSARAVEALLGSDAEAGSASASGWTALHRAAAGKSDERRARKILRELLDAGADEAATTAEGQTALDVAVAYDAPKLVAVLAEGMTVTDRAGPDGTTALQRAAGRGARPIVRALLRAGARPDVVDASSGQTALHCAAANGHRRICEALIDEGADAGLADRDGKLAVELAQEAGHLDVARVLARETR